MLLLALLVWKSWADKQEIKVCIVCCEAISESREIWIAENGQMKIVLLDQNIVYATIATLSQSGPTQSLA